MAEFIALEAIAGAGPVLARRQQCCKLGQSRLLTMPQALNYDTDDANAIIDSVASSSRRPRAKCNLGAQQHHFMHDFAPPLLSVYTLFIQTMSLGRAVPWATWEEWRQVGQWLLCGVPGEVQRGLDRVSFHCNYPA